VLMAGLLTAGTAAFATPTQTVYEVNLQLASKYMTSGWNIGEDEPTFQTILTARDFLPGIYVRWLGSMPLNRHANDADEVDVFLGFGYDVFKHRDWRLNLHGFVDYWLFPRQFMYTDSSGQPIPETIRQGIKPNLGASLPLNLPPAIAQVKGTLTPTYNAYFWTPLEHDWFDSGFMHECMLEYDLPLIGLREPLLPQVVRLRGTVNYHDGAFGMPTGWSHMTAHLILPFNALGVVISSSVHYQHPFGNFAPILEGTWWYMLAVRKNF